jgi:hypothetical protein
MKIQKTFTIDINIYDKFLEICKEQSINKSLFIENKMIDFIKINEKDNDNKKKNS